MEGGIKMEQYNKIKGYRVMIGYSQDEMAAALGINKKSYANKENGTQEFKYSEMVMFLNVVKEKLPSVTMDEIFLK